MTNNYIRLHRYYMQRLTLQETNHIDIYKILRVKGMRGLTVDSANKLLLGHSVYQLKVMSNGVLMTA